MNGMLFQNNPVQGSETSIQLENVIPGTYILKIVKNKKEIKTFKIIKKLNAMRKLFTFWLPC